jgi:succinate dehydrogenase / fumarate reductase cytochrome b subunit
MSAPATPELPGTAERAEPGPVHHKGPGPAPSGWLDPRGRAIGGRTFALHRITGLALVLYLYVHLGVLSMLLIGRSAWGDFLSVVTAKGFLAFDVVLFFGLLFHALNGIRVAIVGSGFAVSHQQALFWAATALGVPALIYAALRVFGGV